MALKPVVTKLLPGGVKRTEGLVSLFDASPITVGGFRLSGRTATAVGRPSISQWTAALQFTTSAEDASPYWIGDLLEYAKQRGDWSKDLLDQAMTNTGLALQTLYNRHYIATKVKERARQAAPSYSHARVVAKVETEDEQVEWLDKSISHGWTPREMDVNIKASKRRKVIEGQAVLVGMYRVLYADPPWIYGDKPPSGSGAQTHYPGMTIAQLCALPVKAHTYKDAVLFMWVTAPLLLQNPGPREVLEAWGFEPKTGMVWDKVLSAGGHYVASKHEHLIIATRGSCTPDHPVPSPDSVQVIRRPGEHSEKPEEFRKIIEQLYDGPYLELFGRKAVEGWDVFGNDAALWHQEKVG